MEFGGGLVTDESEESSQSTGLIIAFVALALAWPRAGRSAPADHRGAQRARPHSHHGTFDAITVSAVDNVATMLGSRSGSIHPLHPGPAPTKPRRGSGTARIRRTSHGDCRKRSGFAGLTCDCLGRTHDLNIPFLTVMGLAAATR